MHAQLLKNSFEPFFFDDRGFALYQGDSLELLEAMEPESVDMIFADPPYFLSNDGITCKSGKMVSVNKGRWDRSLGVTDNHEFNRRWVAACQRLLKPNGTMWVTGTHHVIYSLGFCLQETGFKILNDITWYKINPPPNLSCRYFTHGTETVIWAARDHKSKHTFHYKLCKEMNGGKQMQNVWNILPPRKAEKLHGKHPTQKPLELLRRIVLSASNPGDLILDPFTGSSTTGIAAVENGRRFVGIDQDEKFLELSIKRFADLPSQEDLEAPAP